MPAEQAPDSLRGALFPCFVLKPWPARTVSCSYTTLIEWPVLSKHSLPISEIKDIDYNRVLYFFLPSHSGGRSLRRPHPCWAQAPCNCRAGRAGR